MKSLNIYRMSVFFVAFASSLAMAPQEGNLVSPLLFLGLSAPFWWARNRAGLFPPKNRNQFLILNVILSVVALLLV